jgi:ABC-type transport system involved in cytochrome c biogenesis permease subunit
MALTERLEQYAALLRIRHTAARRGVWIMGLSFLGLIVVVYLFIQTAYPSYVSIYIMSIFVTVAGLGFYSMRLEYMMLKSTLELVDMLRRATSETPPAR